MQAYFLLVAFMVLAPLQGSAQEAGEAHAADRWYKRCIIYNLDVHVFKDSDGDGTGDFQGLIQKLDYLKALGVDVIWLAPFQPSPQKDDGYDVADYYGVDSSCGTPGDFSEFMYQARQRGLRVMMDVVLNHTSAQHPWFKRAREDTSSPYYHWYSWSGKRPSNYNEGMAFPGVQQEVWSYDTAAGAYYYHRFYKFQPDLNFEHPQVRAESRRILAYWLQQGVSGFRLDAVPFMIEKAVPGNDKPPQQYEIIPDMQRFVQWRKGDAITLGEANVPPSDNAKYFGENGEGLQMMFNFYVNQHLFYALATGKLSLLIKALQETREKPAIAQWAHFLRNHDEIDLGRLTDRQRQEVYAAMGPEKRMQLYERGIRRRLAPMLGNDRRRLEMAYSLLLALPGTPVIRYGEEIGMGDNLQLPERLAIRTPMQWSAEPNGGFTTSRQPIRPVISGGEYGYEKVNVAQQQSNAGSLLNWMAKMIKLRKQCPGIGVGDWKVLPTGTDQVLGLQYTYKGETLIVLHNFGNAAQQVQLSSLNGNSLYNLLNGSIVPAAAGGRYYIGLDGYGYAWLRSW